MSYQQALEAAGASVLAFESFGSYQGEWFALVEFNGERGWINGSFGSCSGCDAFEGEFGYDDELCEEHRWTYRQTEGCEACKAKAAEYQRKLADFGKAYLDTLMTQAAAEAQAAQNLAWDSEAQEMLDFVKANALPCAPRGDGNA